MKRLHTGSYPVFMILMVLLLGMGTLFVSCREPEPEFSGNLQIRLADASSKSILPSDTAIEWITVEGFLHSDHDVTLARQSFELGATIGIKGLSAGTWTISVTGYNGDPQNGGVALTPAAVDSDVVIRSGQTTSAVFALHYLGEGVGSAKVSVLWPNHSVVDVDLAIRDVAGDSVAALSKGVGTTKGGGATELQSSSLPVGNYDLDVTLTNASGTVMTFPMIDMLSIFNALESTGTITLVASDVPQAEMPTFSATPDGKEVTSRTVTIDSATPNATIYYTVDGSEPAFSEGNPAEGTMTYTGPFAIVAAVTEVHAIAVEDGYQDSSCADSGELTVGSSDDSGVEVDKPALISNIVISSASEVYLENPRFAMTYDLEGTPRLDSVTWYLDGTELDDTDNDDGCTCEGYLSAGRHQITVRIVYFDGNESKTALQTLRFNNNGQAAKPVIMAGRSETQELKVTISSSTPDARIYYTCDESEPTKETGLVYEEPFVVELNTVVKAMAAADEYRDSEVADVSIDSSHFDITTPSTVTNVVVHLSALQAGQPRFTVTYDKTNVEGETIAWYLDDNTSPLMDVDRDGDQKTCTYGMTLDAGRHQIRAKITYLDGTRTQFAVGTLRFDIERTATPVIATTQVEGGKQVTLSCATEGATVYCTTNGYEPDVHDAQQIYTDPFVVPMGTTVRAVAIHDGFVDSEASRKTVQYGIGDTGPAGGVVFALDTTDSYDWDCLEAAPADDGSFVWGGDGQLLETTKTDLGSGRENTDVIVDALGTESCAAGICSEKSVEYGGSVYDDWFLPSRDELDALYTCWKETGKGTLSEVGYWTSSEDNAYIAWTQDFVDGSKNYGNGKGSKAVANRIRAVRAFCQEVGK